MKKKTPGKITNPSTQDTDPTTFHGISASPGIAIGSAYVLEKAEFKSPRYWINHKETNREVARFDRALEQTRQELEKIRDKLCRFEGKEQIHLLDAYTLILQEEMLTQNTQKTIEQEHINAEWALTKNLGKIRESLSAIEEPYFKERIHDFNYIGERILKHLVGRSEDFFKRIPKGSILVAHDLSPTETSLLTKFKVKGIVTEIGGSTSHMVIVSRALEIPTVVGCPGVSEKIQSGDKVILDGSQGVVIAKPSSAQEQEYENTRKHVHALQRILLRDVHLPSETQDRTTVHLAANMELIEELPSIKENGAEGIGLYRTEFLFLNRKTFPTETEQFENYKKILSAVYPHSTTIRTLDVGADKIPLGQNYGNQTNPALGLRAIRLSLKERQGFKIQLRAMLRASPYGKLKILFPLISDLEELRKAKQILKEVQDELKKEKIDFDPHVQVGAMIEVPSAVWIARELAKEVHFFSVGTNDLIQYTLAIDRSNEHVAYLYHPLHPAILRMLKTTVEAAQEAQIPVSLCGEMAGDPLLILVLIGMGLHELSMNALSIPRAKRIIRSVHFADAKGLFEKMLTLGTTQEMEAYVRQEMNRLLGKSFREYALQSP